MYPVCIFIHLDGLAIIPSLENLYLVYHYLFWNCLSLSQSTNLVLETLFPIYTEIIQIKALSLASSLICHPSNNPLVVLEFNSGEDLACLCDKHE